MVAAWDDLSPKPDRNNGLILQRTISAELGKQVNFRVVPAGLTNSPVTDYSEAVSQGRDAKADVVVFGSYYIEKDKIFVTAEVYDVLENRLKMRRVYTGEATEDIFDTIDSMASDIVKKIKEALPEMTAESEVNVKKIRQTLYESEKVNIKRMFYTRIGFVTDEGTKNLILGFNNANNIQTTNTFNGPWPISSMEFGAGVRYWDIRFDFDISGITGLPNYDWNLQNYPLYVPNHVSFTGAYYLPWWGGSVALGFGIYSQNENAGTNNQVNNNGSVYNTENYSGVPISFVIIYNPSPDFEFTLQFSPWFETTNQLYNTNGNNNVISYNMPPITFGATYFIGDFGLSARLTYDTGSYYNFSSGGNNNGSNGSNSSPSVSASTFEDLYISIGLVYRVDFL
jgi:TolB-like protein